MRSPTSYLKLMKVMFFKVFEIRRTSIETSMSLILTVTTVAECFYISKVSHRIFLSQFEDSVVSGSYICMYN